MATLSAKEIVNKHFLTGTTNEKLIKYGKINKNMAYELTQNHGAYLDWSKYHLRVILYNPDTDKTESMDNLNKYECSLEEINNHIEKMKNKIL